MRFRKLAGVVAGALTLGMASVPLLSTAAQAEASSSTAFLSTMCKYSSYQADYRTDYTVAVDGTDVSVTFAKGFQPGATSPNFNTIQFKTITPTMVLDVDGQAVTVSGLETYPDVSYGDPNAQTGATEMAMPTLTGSLSTADDDVQNVSLTSMTIPMKISVNSVVQNVSGTMTCTQDTVANLDVSCSYQSFKMFYGVKAYLNTKQTKTAGTTDTTNVRAYLGNDFSAGMPSFLAVNSQTPTMSASIADEAVDLTGTQTYDPARPGNTALAMPRLTGTRTGTAALTGSSVTGFATSLNISAFGGDPSDYAIPCEVYAPTQTTTDNTGDNALTCAYSSFPGINYPATLDATYDHKDVTGQLSDVNFGMPATFQINSVKASMTGKADNTAISLASDTDTFGTAKAGNADISVPEMSGTTDAVLFPAATTIDTVMFDVNVTAAPYSSTPTDATIVCGLAAGTTTTLAGNSPDVDKVSLSATVDSADAAGSVAFYEGDSKVGQADVASGVASFDLDGVSQGDHTYTAKFTPSAPNLYAPSTSDAVTITVDTQACVDAKAALTAAQGKVTSATKAVNTAKGKVATAKSKATKAKTAVTKATKKAKKAAKAVKKLKKAKKTKANKKKLAKAKKAAKKANKALAKAKKALKTANGAVTAANKGLTKANGQLTSAKAQLTSAQTAVNAAC